MVILDEKTLMLPPPPPYVDAGPLLLRIVYETFAQGKVERQRKVLYWLTMSLRLVNQSVYIACMHVLRSTYLPAYAGLIRPPYTSDPFPHGLSGLSAAPSYTPSPPLSALLPAQSLQRETHVLDLFIALKVREDVWADESELHLEREESFKDLFDLMQPRARVEDLVRTYGVRDGSVAIPLPSGATPVATTPIASSFPTPPSPQEFKDRKERKEPLPSGSVGRAGGSSRYTFSPLPFTALTVSFSPRAVGLVLTTRQSKRKIVEVARTRDEALEVSAKKLVKQLRAWIAVNPSHGVR